MSYDAMRVLLRVAMIKRSLMDIYLETIKDAPRGTHRHTRQILTDTSHAYVVISQLYDHVQDWRTHHADEMRLPPDTLSLSTIASFIEHIAGKADMDAYSIGDFPERSSNQHCNWAAGRYHLRTDDDDDGDDDYHSDAPDALSDGGDSDDPLFGGTSDDDALFAHTDASDEFFDDAYDDEDYPAMHADVPASDGDASNPMTHIMPSDAYDVYFGWGMASHHRDGMPTRRDFACADMAWPQPDTTLPPLNDRDCRRIFGVYVLPPSTPLRVVYDIFGNIIGWEPVARPDDPDYNVPGAA